MKDKRTAKTIAAIWHELGARELRSIVTRVHKKDNEIIISLSDRVSPLQAEAVRSLFRGRYSVEFVRRI